MCDKVVSERLRVKDCVCVTKLCVTKSCVEDCVTKLCERFCFGKITRLCVCVRGKDCVWVCATKLRVCVCVAKLRV